MLSGETAAGKYPVEAVKTMSNIAKRTEQSLNYNERLKNKKLQNITVTNAISLATCSTAMVLNASAIITFTSSGHTARMVSRFRPQCPIIATTQDKGVMRRLSLSWGVFPVAVDNVGNIDEMIHRSIESSKNKNYINEGDLVVITAGAPIGVKGTTNLIKVETVEK